uniref:Uncharacterized protein n=1 Tax=Caenorhabditis tropicalis TaxID=1561998 RepID=A0A1I7UE30_9PELO
MQFLNVLFRRKIFPDRDPHEVGNDLLNVRPAPQRQNPPNVLFGFLLGLSSTIEDNYHWPGIENTFRERFPDLNTDVMSDAEVNRVIGAVLNVLEERNPLSEAPPPPQYQPNRFNLIHNFLYRFSVSIDFETWRTVRQRLPNILVNDRAVNNIIVDVEGVLSGL